MYWIVMILERASLVLSEKSKIVEFES